MSRNSGFTPDNKISYLFIDAGYLNFRIKNWAKYFENNPMEIDYQKFTNGYSKIFFYDGVIDGDEEKQELLDRLREIPNFHVLTGRIKGKGAKKRQKQVDILISVNMLMHTIRSNMDSCTLLAGDEDFKPLIDALIQEGMNVTIWAEKQSASDLLLYSADRKQYFTALDLWKNCTKVFQEKYPLPKSQGLSLMQSHQIKYKHLAEGNIGSRKIYKIAGDNGITIALQSENSQAFTMLNFMNENNFNQYLKVINAEIKWLKKA